MHRAAAHGQPLSARRATSRVDRRDPASFTRLLVVLRGAHKLPACSRANTGLAAECGRCEDTSGQGYRDSAKGWTKHRRAGCDAHRGTSTGGRLEAEYDGQGTAVLFYHYTADGEVPVRCASLSSFEARRSQVDATTWHGGAGATVTR